VPRRDHSIDDLILNLWLRYNVKPTFKVSIYVNYPVSRHRRVSILNSPLQQLWDHSKWLYRQATPVHSGSRQWPKFRFCHTIKRSTRSSNLIFAVVVTAARWKVKWVHARCWVIDICERWRGLGIKTFVFVVSTRLNTITLNLFSLYYTDLTKYNKSF
jgi:hypothetical protein